MTKNSKQRGFTIIEVALVLAVAALIFLVVFLAVPALQRNQRNDAIKRDIAFVVEQVSSFVSNQNALPAQGTTTDAVWFGTGAATTGFATYFGDGLSTNTTIVKTSGSAPPASWVAPGQGTIVIYNGYRCQAAPALPPQADSGGRRAAVVGSVEISAGSYEPYCQSV